MEPLVASATRATVCGSPVFEGRVLSADDSRLTGLRTLPEYCAFARRLRGQFCILARSGQAVTAVTDPLGSYPVYLLDGPTGPQLATRLGELARRSGGGLSRQALFSYVRSGGIGLETLYADIRILPPAAVVRVEHGRAEFRTYFRWADHLGQRPVGVAEARRRFVEVACSYLGALAGRAGPLGCALSGGTDSALVAGLLRHELANPVRCFTLHYRHRRYSELGAARASAARLAVPLAPVLVRGRDFRASWRRLNGASQDRPCFNAQAALFHRLGSAAAQAGVGCVATGEHADILFLGLDGFFDGLPRRSVGYLAAVKALSAEEKLERLVPRPAVSAWERELLGALGLEEEAYRAWLDARFAHDRSFLEPLVGRASLPVLQQLLGQVWAGIPWQHLSWPVEQALDGIRFVSPFYDIEMVKFALALPDEHKFRDGLTKALLRDVLRGWPGWGTLPKRCLPSPARLWSLWPGLGVPSGAPAGLGALYGRLVLRNLARLGGRHGDLAQVAALALWLACNGLRA